MKSPSQFQKIKFLENNIIKKPWDDRALKIALVYPNTYLAGMGGYTIQLLYALFNQFDDVICERAFYPLADFPTHNPNEKLDRSSKTSSNIIMRSIESQMPLSQFDILAFTVQYELDYPNILRILNNAQIPLLHKDRFHFIDSDHNSKSNIDNQRNILPWPLILVGGPVIRANPLPLQPLIDLALIGELEPVIEPFIQAWRKTQETESSFSQNRIKFLESVYSIEGFWIPDLATNELLRQIKRVFLKNLDDGFHPVDQIVPQFEPGIENPLPFGETLFLEINRGCPHGCRFCLTGHQLKPFRNRSFATLKNIIDDFLVQTKIRHITLIGASVTDHPQFETLYLYLIDKGFQVTVPSLRIETVTPKIAKLLVQGGLKTVSIAPETGSNTLRQTLNKCVTNDQILHGGRILFENGIQNLKLYFIYGLPFEKQEDLEAIIALIHDLGQIGFGKDALRISLNPFIPKAHTPFEAEVDNYLDPKMSVLCAKLQYLESELKSFRQVKLETLDLYEAYLQTAFALGDVRIYALIEKCSQTGFSMKKWFNLAKRDYHDLLFSLYNELQKSTFGQRSWHFINIGVSIAFLVNEFHLAKEGKSGIHCRDECTSCGNCEKL